MLYISNAAMKISAYSLSRIIILICLASCEDVYYPKEINSNSKIPVIQGMLVEGHAPVVNISWALGYNDQVQENISGANVIIRDIDGDSVILEETSPGNYTSLSNAFLGVHGKTYKLDVTLPNGHVYASNQVFLPRKPQIDSIYAKPGVNRVYSYDENNVPFPEDQNGLFIYSDISLKSDSLFYFRINTMKVTQSLYYDQLGTLAEHPVFIWQSHQMDDMYSVDFSITYNDRQVIREYHNGFLQYFYDVSTQSEFTSATTSEGWVLILKVYSISRDVYIYYNSISQQVNGNNQLFAPDPSQVKSNIRCVDAPDTKVIGVFEASSYAVVYKAYKWETLTKYKYKILPTYPDNVGAGVSPRFPPTFWVFF